MLLAQAKPCAFTIETSLYQCAELFRALPGIAKLQDWQVPRSRTSPLQLVMRGSTPVWIWR
jgi:hypothetical protein